MTKITMTTKQLKPAARVRYDGSVSGARLGAARLAAHYGQAYYVICTYTGTRICHLREIPRNANYERVEVAVVDGVATITIEQGTK